MAVTGVTTPTGQGAGSGAPSTPRYFAVSASWRPYRTPLSVTRYSGPVTDPPVAPVACT